MIYFCDRWAPELKYVVKIIRFMSWPSVPIKQLTTGTMDCEIQRASEDKLVVSSIFGQKKAAFIDHIWRRLDLLRCIQTLEDTVPKFKSSIYTNRRKGKRSDVSWKILLNIYTVSKPDNITLLSLSSPPRLHWTNTVESKAFKSAFDAALHVFHR